jgi:hypothetical protein
MYGHQSVDAIFIAEPTAKLMAAIISDRATVRPMRRRGELHGYTVHHEGQTLSEQDAQMIWHEAKF